MSQSAVETRTPTLDDVIELANGLRKQDRDELDAAGHTNHIAVISDGIKRSDWTLTATVDGEVACIFGLARAGSVLAPIGVPWMLGTNLVPRNGRALARLAPQYIQEMLLAYPRLVNVVHARNKVAVGWLRRVGFTLHPAQPHGPHGEPFHVFEVNRV